MSDERILALEEMVAHQARVIEEMSAEMAVQGDMLRRLRKQFEVLAERFASVEENSVGLHEARRPPHW